MSQPRCHRTDRVHWMDRAHRGNADRSGMPDACRAPAAGGARRSCRPSRNGAPDALGTPEFHRSGEPGASRLRSRKRGRSRRAGPLDTRTPQPFQSCLHVGRGHRRTTRDHVRPRAPVPSCNVPRHWDPSPGSPRSTSRFAAPRWHASSPTATTCLPIAASSSQMRSPCTTPPASASNPVPRPTSCLPRIRRCVRPTQQRDADAVRQNVVQEYPQLGLQRNPLRFSEPRPSKSLVAGLVLAPLALSDLSIRLAPFRD